jgi:Flp pilus assembly protein TadG
LGFRDAAVSRTAARRAPIWVRFWRDRRGVVAIAVAVLLPVLIGFAGLGVEVGLWFAIQRQNQSAADAAAISAALEYAAQIESGATTNPAATAAANTAAAYNLFSNPNCSTSGTTNCTLYPCYGFSGGSSCNPSNSNGILGAVKVVLTEPLNTTFANLVTSIWGPNIDVVNVTTGAIAAFPMLPGGRTCLLAVGGNNISLVPAGATLNLPNCALASLSTSGSSIVLSGSGNPNINAAAIATAGNVQITGGSSLPPHTYTYFPLQDPYKNVTTARLSGSIPPGPCFLDPGNGPSMPPTLDPRLLYCGLTFSGNVNVTLPPGAYYIDGGNFTITGLTASSNIRGGGVTIVLTKISASSAGVIDIDPGPSCSATVLLTAPSAGAGLLQPSAAASQGMLFFQDPTAGNTPNTITTGASDPNCATPNVTLNGAIYSPASATTLQGNAVAGAKGCTEVIAQSFAVSGNPGFDDSACSAAGVTLNQAQIRQVYLVM